MPPSARAASAAGADRHADRLRRNRSRTRRCAARGDGVGRLRAACRQPPDGPEPLAPPLLGGVGTARAALPLAGGRRLAGLGAGRHYDGGSLAAGPAGLPPGRGQHPLRDRRPRLPACGGAGRALRRGRLRTLRGDPLVGGLHLRIRRSPVGCASDDRPPLCDVPVCGPDAFSDAARPLGGGPFRTVARARGAGELGRHARRGRLRRHPLPLPAEDSPCVEPARGGAWPTWSSASR